MPQINLPTTPAPTPTPTPTAAVKSGAYIKFK